MIVPVSALDLTRAAIDSAVAAGVREVVLCPGSRSAPLAYAVLAAEHAGHLRLHVRVDERSAGFLALGLAKVSRAPALVITTSGTAVANLHPAVLEAHHGSVPLIVLSADRPAQLRGSGANQTTIQPGIFPGAVRWEADLAADADPRDVGAAVAAAVEAAMGAPASSAPDGRQPGPVHVNLCLGEPLVPATWPLTDNSPLDGPDVFSRRAQVDAADAEVHAASAEVRRGAEFRDASAEVRWSGEFRDDTVRTLLVIGDLIDPATRPEVVRWATARGLPIVAEPFGRHAGTGATLPGAPDPRPGDGPPDPVLGGDAGHGRGADDNGLTTPAALPHGPLLLTDPQWLDAHAPDRVLVAGRVTLSRPVMSLLRRPGLRVDALTDTPVAPDPAGVVGASYPLAAVLSGGGPVPERGSTPATSRSNELADPAATRAPAKRADLATRVPAGPATPSVDDRRTWAAGWRAAGDRLAAAIAAEPPAWPTGLAVARTLVGALAGQQVPSQPSPTHLFVGPSNPVRDLDLGVGAFPPHLTVVANRGLAGIDGCVSTAVGMALTVGSAYALVGDLTFLHDTNALLIGPGEPRPNLTIVVVNDAGGGIFRLLEPGTDALAEPFGRLFGTPTGTDFAALCRAHGVPYARVDTPAELARLVAAPPDGLRVIEVPIDPLSHRSAHAGLRTLATRHAPGP